MVFNLLHSIPIFKEKILCSIYCLYAIFNIYCYCSDIGGEVFNRHEWWPFFGFHFLSEVAKVTKTSKSKCYRANESKFQSHIAISDHRLPLQHFSYWQTMYVSERYEEPNIARHSLILIVSQISLVFHVVTFLFCKR